MKCVAEGSEEQEGHVDIRALVDQQAHTALEAEAHLHQGATLGIMLRVIEQNEHRHQSDYGLPPTWPRSSFL